MKKRQKTRNAANYGVSIGGNVNTAGGDITGRDHIEISQGGPTAEQIAQAFAPIYARIERLEGLSKEDREDVKATTKEIQEEVTKVNKADGSVLQRRLRTLGRMAPDILEVVTTTIANPVLGLGLVAKKIAAKASESGDSSGSSDGKLPT